MNSYNTHIPNACSYISSSSSRSSIDINNRRRGNQITKSFFYVFKN